MNDKPKDKITRDILVDLYINKNLSMKEVAERLDIKYSAIHSYLTKFHINKKDISLYKLLDFDKLYQLYIVERKTKKEIIKELNCCKQTLDKNLKHYNLNRYSFSKELIDKICSMYSIELKSSRQIGKELNIPYNRVRDILISNGITLRNKSLCQISYYNKKSSTLENINKLSNKNNSNEVYKLKRRAYNFFKNHISVKLKKDINCCQICGSNENLHVHHIKSFSLIVNEIIEENEGKDFDELYNIIINDNRFLDIDNLIVVCEKCHYLIFHKYLKYKNKTK